MQYIHYKMAMIKKTQCSDDYYHCLSIIMRKVVMNMIEDSIKAVREAEAKADQLIADAKRQADEIVAKAKADAEQLKADAANEDSARLAEAMEKAKEAGEKALAAGEERSAKIVEELLAKAAPKTGSAVDAVIGGLF
jgi:F0F1-type ATP synthase membrane subunit b/b'